jgi:hypothetical protein
MAVPQNHGQDAHATKITAADGYATFFEVETPGQAVFTFLVSWAGSGLDAAIG